MHIPLIGVLCTFVFACWLTVSGCGSGAPCDLDCEDGFSCLITSGTPTCVADGRSGDGGGGGQIGEDCDSSDDCATTLTCRSGVNGVLSCQP